MYPRNAASPERISIGAVVQISDGAVQTSGCTVRIIPSGGAEGDGGGTTAYSTDGVVLYTPTQAETNYASFIVIAKKAGCFPSDKTIVTTACAVAGQVDVGAISGDSTAADNLEAACDGGTYNVGGGAVVAASVTTKTGYELAADQAVNVTKIGGSAQSLADLKDLADTGYDPSTHKVQGVVLTDTCTTNTDMRGTNSAALASVCTEVRLAALTDWLNGGRLDLLIDGIISTLGVAGAGLTALGDARLANLDAAITSRHASGAAVAKSPATLATGDVTGNLPVDVKAYTVQPTVTGATLHADYDAAKTAAQAGNQMDLVNAPNATAVTAIQNGLATPTNITAGTITTVTHLTNAPTNGDLTATMKSSVTAAVPTANGIADQVWDEAIAGHAGAGSAGATLSAASAPSAASVADAVWDELVADHAGVGSTGAALAAAGGSGDPWSTALPGSYGEGTAGKILGANLNAPVATVDTVVDGIATTLGVAGTGLTALGDTRLANLDATVSSRLSPAGTLATVTNLTNAPSNGDFTSTMKSSITAAVPTAAAIGTDAAGKVLATPAQKLVTDATGRVTVGTNADKTGYSLTVTPPTAAEIKAAIEAAGSSIAQVLEDTGTTLPAAIEAIEAGSGGDATAANQTTIINAIAAMRGTDDDTLETLSDQLDGVTGGAATNITVETSAT